jgi:tripartite-type tricarboxylate transporter receptor subunit TctC
MCPFLFHAAYISEPTMRKFLSAAIAMSLSSAIALAPAQAQEYPAKPVTIVVGVPPGGSTDQIARMIAETMPKYLGGRMLVDNRPGANAAIATRQVARAPADGYTLFYNAVNMATNLVGMKDPGYKWSDFESIGGVAYAPYVMFVNTSSSKSKTLKEFIDYGKANPGSLTFASLGPGSSPGLVAERLNSLTGIGYRDIPYKGGGPAMQDLVGGTVDVYFPLANAAAALAGKPNMVVFGVTGEKRSELLPNVPTFAELGYPQMTDVLSGGMWVAAGTPKPILDKLRKAMADTLKDAGFIAALKKAGQSPYEGDHVKYSAAMRTVEEITREDYKKFKLEPQ